MAEKEPEYEDVIGIAEKAFGKAKGGERDIRACSCKSGCKEDCQDWVSNVASTGGYFAGIATS